MKIRGLAATMLQARVYRLQTYKVVLTRKGVYQWRVTAKDPNDKTPDHLLSWGDNFYEIDFHRPYLTLEDMNHVTNTKQMRVANTTLIKGKLINTSVIISPSTVMQATYRDADNRLVLRGSVNNRDLTEAEVEELSAHEKFIIMQERKAADDKVKARKNERQKAIRKAAKDKKS